MVQALEPGKGGYGMQLIISLMVGLIAGTVFGLLLAAVVGGEGK